MPADPTKPAEHGFANGLAPQAGATVQLPATRLPTASTLSEENMSEKVHVSAEGRNATIEPLDRVRVDSSGQMLTTNQGVVIADDQNSLKYGGAHALTTKGVSMDSKAPRPLAIVTGASSGIGLELARCAARHGYNILAAADTPLEPAVISIRNSEGNVHIETVEVDLSTEEGVDKLLAGLANAGHGLGGAFLEQDFAAVRHVSDTNITGTIYLLQHAARMMREHGGGRILVTGSIAGFQPGSFQAVYNGTGSASQPEVSQSRPEADASYRTQ